MARVVLASALSRWLPASAGRPSREIALDVPGARLDEAASDGERRRVRHDARLARFREEAAAACR